MPDDAIIKNLSRRALIITGAYGSGKTEVAVNLAVYLKQFHESQSIIDLDIVNPYFRSREAVEFLEAAGVEVVVPRGEQFFAELPIILPEVRGHLSDPQRHVVVDVGGDDVGARVLRSLQGAINTEETEFIFILNVLRPFTSTVQGASRVMKEIEQAAGMRITALAANAHLMDETDASVLAGGYEITSQLAAKSGLPFLFMTVERQVAAEISPTDYDVPLLQIHRLMRPPWQEPNVQYGKARGRIQI
ncbi:MAG: cobalamin biosynthesis protein CbiA [Candidatus Delongbacteria bacterium]|nr:cobalamin biosynthesis protein CbiA [bacterium]MBL7032593.1 cobalamin biosynthesis protein CbiA [Candidatus Delongbacteria bacterium]